MTNRKPVIALLAGPRTSAAVLYGLHDILATTGAVFLDMISGEPGSEELDVRIVSIDGRPFRCFGDVPVEPDDSLATLTDCDLVVVSDMYSPIYASPRDEFAIYGPWLRQMYAQGCVLSSVCSGALVLAEAGLLDGQEVTSHWAYGELFEQDYPRVRLRREIILCLSAESDRIVTAGGGTAWQELVLYIVHRFCGAAAAREIAKVYLLAGHDSGQLPYATMNRRRAFGDAVIESCQEWIAMNYQQESPVHRMVELSGLNPRTFARRFRAATGRTPIDYVMAVRMEEAKQILETTSLSVEDVSWQAGYQNCAAFRRTFRKHTGLSPADYRRRFSHIGIRPS